MCRDVCGYDPLLAFTIFIRAGRREAAECPGKKRPVYLWMGAVALNLFRIFQIYVYSLTPMVLANVVAFICILIAFIRSERGQDKDGTGA